MKMNGRAYMTNYALADSVGLAAIRAGLIFGYGVAHCSDVKTGNPHVVLHWWSA